MGNCVGAKPAQESPCVSTSMSACANLSPIESHMLKLIFEDLSNRIVEHGLNLENFLNLFHKDGFWGERLFHEFTNNKLIKEHQFLQGIARIFKSSESEKITLLYRFFSRNHGDGVRYKEFLTMLYNYPKDDLKAILSDRDFIDFELKKELVPCEYRPTVNTIQSFGRLDALDCVKGDQLNGGMLDPKGFLKPTTYRYESTLKQIDERSNNQSSNLASLIGEDILQYSRLNRIAQKYIAIEDGNSRYEIPTNDVHQLVKRFATMVFNEAKIDKRTGRLSQKDFQEWIKNHKSLYLNYYENFHSLVWELDQHNAQPKYLTNAEKTSQARLLVPPSVSAVNIMLSIIHSILVLESIDAPSEGRLPIRVICMQGLTVRNVMHEQNGFGIEITHRDGVYPQTHMYFKDETLLREWMQLLRYYKGSASIHQLYEFGKKIGTGKFSIIYECKRISTKQKYAIKVIETVKLSDKTRQLIAHQSSIMQIVSHPLLLGFKEYLQTKTHFYLVTELVQGKDLFEFVKEFRHLEEEDAAEIAKQIIVGVRYLHSFEIVHRDLKPQNIMIEFNQETSKIQGIKIIDFGFANYLSSLREKDLDDLLVGTPNYIAPEILAERPIVTLKMDNFAIGAIIYFMVSGKLPFNHSNINEILRKTIMDEYSFDDRVWAGVSDEVKDLISNLLCNSVQHRISLQSALSHPWFGKFRQKPQKFQKQKANR